MKRFFCVLAAALLLCALAGCSAPESAQIAWDLSDAEPVYLTEWPENEFTAQIVEPEHGEIDYVCDYSEEMRYLIVLKNMPEGEPSQYVEALKALGYAEIASDGNNVSVGTLLQKDNVVLSIAHSGEMLSVLITME